MENTLQVLTSGHVINYVHELENIMAAEYIFN